MKMKGIACSRRNSSSLTFCRRNRHEFCTIGMNNGPPHFGSEVYRPSQLMVLANKWTEDSRYHNTMPSNDFLPSIFIGRQDKISHPPSDGIVQIATSGPSCVTPRQPTLPSPSPGSPPILDLGNGRTRTIPRGTGGGAGAESAAPATTTALLLAAPFARALAMTPPYKSSPRSDAGFQFTPPTDNARSANGAMAWFKVLPNPRSMCFLSSQ